MTIQKRTTLCITVIVSTLNGIAHAQFLGPSPYVEAADSPFASVNFSSGYFHLEDFEDGFLNTPGASSLSGTVLGPGFTRDSVDADDGLIDGFGRDGHSFFDTSQVYEFLFDDVALGSFPTHVGIVWTDVGFSSPTDEFDQVTFEAFNSAGVSLGTLGPTAVGDGVRTGETEEDRFFGMISSTGISRITMTSAGSTDWEVDHLQYGFVPEPSTFTLAALSLIGIGCHRRKRA